MVQAYMKLMSGADVVYSMIPTNGGWSAGGVGKGSLSFSFEVKDGNATYFNLGNTGSTSNWGWVITVWLNSETGVNAATGTNCNIYNLSNGIHNYKLVWDNNEQTHYIDQVSVLDSTADTTAVRGINFWQSGSMGDAYYHDNIVIKDLVQDKTVTISFLEYPTDLNQTVSEYLLSQGMEGWGSEIIYNIIINVISALTRYTYDIIESIISKTDRVVDLRGEDGTIVDDTDSDERAAIYDLIKSDLTIIKDSVDDINTMITNQTQLADIYLPGLPDDHATVQEEVVYRVAWPNTETASLRDRLISQINVMHNGQMLLEVNIVNALLIKSTEDYLESIIQTGVENGDIALPINDDAVTTYLTSMGVVNNRVSNFYKSLAILKNYKFDELNTHSKIINALLHLYTNKIQIRPYNDTARYQLKTASVWRDGASYTEGTYTDLFTDIENPLYDLEIVNGLNNIINRWRRNDILRDSNSLYFNNVNGLMNIMNTDELSLLLFPPPPPPICFPAGTPVTTDQGPIAIEKLNSDKHTIRGKEIVAITQSRPLQKHIVCFETDALSKNVPSQQTLCSKNHKVFYNGEMTKARNIVDMCENVTLVDYNGETLFNVLLKKHDKMMINNLICETLHPENIMAKISTMKNGQKKNTAIRELTRIIKENNVPEYQKLYASL